jgi:DNA-binding beta-propeller fold protein YncE
MGLAVIGALTVALLLSSAPALALSQRGHVFNFPFGSGGSGPGEFSNPAGVAVNESTGDVYVADQGNNRVEQFGPEGKYIRTFAAATPALKGPFAVAVDNSHSALPSEDPSAGDVYVVAGADVDKFSAEGAFLRHLAVKEKSELGVLDGIAVDANGDVWLDGTAGEIITLDDGEPNKQVGEAITSEAPGILGPGLAVDSKGDVYVRYEPAEEFAEEPGEKPCETAPCYVAKLTSTEEGAIGPGGVLIAKVGTESTAGVAVEGSGSADDVYLDPLTSLAAFTSTGSLIQHFGSGHLTSASGMAVNPRTGDIYVADAAAEDVDVFSLEEPGPPVVDGLSASKVTATSAELHAEVDPTGSMTTDEFQYGTSPFQPGSVSCSAGACKGVRIPGDSGEGYADEPVSALVELEPSITYYYRIVAKNGHGEVASGEATFTTQPAAETFALPDHRAWELVSSPTMNGAGIESITEEGGVIQASEDGTKITYVATAPDEPRPEGNRGPEFTQILSERIANGQGQKEWSSKDIATPNDKPTGKVLGKAPEYQFFSADLSLSIVHPWGSEPALSEEASERTVYRRDDEGCAPPPSSCYQPLVTGREGYADVPPGTKFGPVEEKKEGIGFEAATPDLSHVVLKSEEVALTSEPAAPNSVNLYEWAAPETFNNGKPNEPTEQLHLINILPGGLGPASGAALGDKDSNVWHALSASGERAFWTAEGHLYMRDMARGETLQIDVPAAGVTEPGPPSVRYQTATPEGSRVFFTDGERLTAGSHASIEHEDLYECEIVEQGGKLACNLADLTEDELNPGEEGAAVQGVVMGASEEAPNEGASVYFVAEGVLSNAPNAEGEKATPGDCELAGTEEQTCNLYLDTYNQSEGKWQPPTFIARLANPDEPDWTAEPASNLAVHTSRVSPNGRYLAFMSSRSLTGYDNLDAASGEPDEEVFLYDASTGKLVCASCNPSGARPSGIFDTRESGEGLGLLVDRPLVWAPPSGYDHWLSANVPGWTALSNEKALYQSRYLSNKGRLFFNSAESLVPADVNGKEDVYEYEPPGIGSCESSGGCVALISSGASDKESAFLDASTNGDDVFFLTAAPLVAAGQEANFGVYDARVCEQGAETSCITSTPPSSSTCASESSCKGAISSLPALATASSETLSGTGNLAPQGAVLPVKSSKTVKKPTRAQELAKALKQCKKLKSKKKRASCEKSARKKYGAKKASRTGAKKASRTSRRSPATARRTAQGSGR